jgi:hypothetical protein
MSVPVLQKSFLVDNGDDHAEYFILIGALGPLSPLKTAGQRQKTTP